MEKWEIVDNKIDILSRSHSELRGRVDVLASKLEKHELILGRLEKTESDIAEMVTMFHSMRGGIVVLGWIGTFAKWVWPILAFVIAIAVYLKTGKLKT